MIYTPTPIDKALTALLEACGLRGESGTEQLYYWLQTACHELEGTITTSHAEGLCCNMNAALADKLAEYVASAQELQRKQGH